MTKFGEVPFHRLNIKSQRTSDDGRVKGVPLQEAFDFNPSDLWMPDPKQNTCPEFSFETYQEEGFVKVDNVDLAELKSGSVLYIYCVNPHAFYTIEIRNDNEICMWRDRGGDTRGLVGSQSSLQTIDQNSVDSTGKKCDVFPGKLFVLGSEGLNPRVIFPFFKFDENQRALSPDETWIDQVRAIYLKESVG